MVLLKFIRHLYYQLLPAICILCHSSIGREQNICRACLADLPILPNCCLICARFLVSEIQSAAVCGACLKARPAFDRTFALFPYQPPIIKLIYSLKFHHQLSYANAFGKLLLFQIEHSWYKNQPLPDIIIPVPLHPKRLRQRGFNQALEITKLISKAFKIPLDDGIVRIKNTAAQSGLKAAERKQNLHNAFILKNHTHNYTNANIAIIDDVITTGCTAQSLSQVLKANGAKNIHVWCCARRG